MKITQEALKIRVQKRMQGQREMLAELFQQEEFAKLCEKHGTTLVDLSNSLITEILASSDMDLKAFNDPAVFGMIDRFLEDISKKLNLHPSDSILLLTKVFSDMMVQATTVIKMQLENVENESEDNNNGNE